MDEDSGTYSGLQATGIDDGDPEVDQSLTFYVSNDNQRRHSRANSPTADQLEAALLLY